jgi:hypothetical protein
MGFSDLVTLYAATVATGVAIFQFVDWRDRRKLFSIQWLPSSNEIYDGVEISITYIGSLPIKISYVGVGYSFRPWKSPWHRKPADSEWLRELKNDSFEVVQREMKRGDVLDCQSDNESLPRWNPVGTSWPGFGFSPSILIDHSLDNQTYVRVLN